MLMPMGAMPMPRYFCRESQGRPAWMRLADKNSSNGIFQKKIV